MAQLVLQVGVLLERRLAVHGAVEWATLGAQRVARRVHVAEPVIAARLAQDVVARKPGDRLGPAIP